LNKKMTTWSAALAALACAGSLQAHHSSALFDMSTHIWLKGTVVRYEAINPHALIELEERTGDGQIQRWIVEGPRLGRLERLGVDGDFVNIGDVIEVCGFFGKDDVSRNSRVHGHVLVLADGQKWQWGPYGRLERCVHPDDWDSIATGSNPLRTN
jgi:hypothetical protein